MKLTMYNVNFGDCFLLREQDDILLVDFGSKSKEEVLQNVVNEVRNEVSSATGIKSALLTHYHVDHYKFFKSWNESVDNSPEKMRIFDAFYLPYIYFDKDKQLCTLAEEAIYTYIFTQGQSEQAKFFLADSMKMLLDTVKKKGNIGLLSEGDRFSLKNIPCEVLWPRKIPVIISNLHDFQTYLSNTLQNYTKKKAILSDSDKDRTVHSNIVDDVWNVFKKLEANMCEYFDVLSGDDNKFIRQWDDKTKNMISELSQSQDELLNTLKEFASDIEWDNSNHQHDRIKGRLRNLYRADNNATSVVFRVLCKKSNEQNCYKLLMTGDITKRILQTKLKRYFEKTYYCCIKCPHHGTSGHYSDCLRQCDWLLISTNRFGRYGKISKKYKFEKNDKNVCGDIRFVKKLCTNGVNNCELCEKNQSCMRDEKIYLKLQRYQENNCLDIWGCHSQCTIHNSVTLEFLEQFCDNSS